MLFGTNAQIMEVDKGTEWESGRMYNDEEDRNLRQVAVLGNEIKKTFFGESDAIGEVIKIKGQSTTSLTTATFSSWKATRSR